MRKTAALTLGFFVAILTVPGCAVAGTSDSKTPAAPAKTTSAPAKAAPAQKTDTAAAKTPPAATTAATPAAASATKLDPALAKAVEAAKGSLESGIKASEPSGTPVEAKYQLDKSQLELVVYTMKGDKFSEVIVNQDSGKVLRTEPLTGPELKTAQEEAKVIAKAKIDLASAAAVAERDHKGCKTIKVAPALKSSHAVAGCTLLKPDGSALLDTEEKLD